MTGSWLHAHTRYDDFPDEPGKDTQEFISAQTNIALLAALMLTVMADMLFNFANEATFVGFLLTFLMWTSTALFFMSCTWSVFLIMCLTQADTEEEADILLVKFGTLASTPVRQWVSAGLILAAALVVWFAKPVVDQLWPPEESENERLWGGITTGACLLEEAFVAVYLIGRVAQCIQLVYEAKRYYKRRNMSYFAGQLDEEFKASIIVISAGTLRANLDDFVSRVGFDHLREDMFLRFLYSVHAKDPGELQASGIKDPSLVTQRFSLITKRLAEQMFEDAVEKHVEKELASIRMEV